MDWFASAGRARALPAGRRTEEEEMYSVRRRKETGLVARLGAREGGQGPEEEFIVGVECGRLAGCLNR